MEANSSVSIFYKIGHALSHFIFSTLYETDVYGESNIPRKGSFILACNHSSFFDPFIAGCFFQRPIYFFARNTLFTNRIAAWFLKKFNAIPVNISGSDPSSLKRIISLLKSGQGLLLFPEGTRSYDGAFLPAKKGIGMIACRTQSPVVPLYIQGAHKTWPRKKSFPVLKKKIVLTYGKPISGSEYDPGREDSERYQKASNLILSRIKSLHHYSRDSI